MSQAVEPPISDGPADAQAGPFRTDRPAPAIAPTLGGPPERLPPLGVAAASVNPWLLAGIVTVATFMEVLDTSIANVALPHIAGNLSASQEESTWVLTSYLVANAIVIPTSGWLSSVLGRKRFFISCVLLFTLSSAMCGMAASLPMLVVFRVMQGLGGGGLQPSVQAVLVDLFPGSKRGMAMAFYTIAMLCAPVLGPTVGGWITDNYSWRWIFYINVPIGIACLIASQMMLYDPPYLVERRKAMHGQPLHVDFVGLACLSLGLGCMEIMLDKGQEDDWFSSHLILGLAVIGGGALLLAIVWELLHPRPMLNLRLLGERNFAMCCLIALALYACIYASNVLLPEMMQNLMGYSPTEAGLILSPAGLFTMVEVPIVGYLLVRGVDARALIALGLLVVAVSTLWMARLDLGAAPSDILWPRVFQSMGSGLMFVPLSTIAFQFLPREESGNAAAMYALVRNEGSSLGVAISSTLLARDMQTHQAYLVGHITPYSPMAMHFIHQMAAVAGGSDPAHAAKMGLQMVYSLVMQQASILSYLDQYRQFGFLILLIIPLVFLLKHAPADRRMPAEAVH
jgi:DHA2 family multidrug resistance protein